MALVRASYRPIPERLYHYTNGMAAYSIISGGKGKDEEICFWLKNAKCKNDAAELKLGAVLVDGLQQYMKRNNRASVINEIDITPELVFINSFTEGEDVTQHMLKEYGNFRLAFDLREYKHRNDIHECTYFKEEDIDELVQCYCATFDRDWKLISGVRKDINALVDYLAEGMGAVKSIPLLKYLEEWEEESEWRHVLHRQSKDERVFTLPDGAERMRVYYPASALIEIKCFSTRESKNMDLERLEKIKDWIVEKDWDVDVVLAMY